MQMTSFRAIAARLDPPPEGLRPRFSASHAWGFVQPTSNPRATYELVLGSYSALLPSTGGVPSYSHRLVWAVIVHHLLVLPVGGFTRAGGSTASAVSPPCFLETQVTLVDATTGESLEESTFG
jgi:hypothetical protein